MEGDHSSAKLHPKGIPQIYELIKKIITPMLPDFDVKSGVTALDAAAGNGYLTSWLHQQAFQITALDINTDQWAVEDVPCTAADLNENLPLEEAQFDLVVSVETIEHIENPYHLLREFARVLKPGGYMILSTPNVHSFRSRMKYTVLSMPSLFEYVSDDNMGQHITPVSIGTLLYAFDRNNMQLVDLYTAGPRPSLPVRVARFSVNALSFQVMKNIRRANSHNYDYYLHRLSDKQLRRLIDEMILVVIARKES